MNFIGPLTAFAVTAALIVMLRPLAFAVGLVDIPTTRKSHKGNVPLIGGLAIFVGAAIALASYQFFGTTELTSIAPLNAFFQAAIILLFVGAWDDYRPLPARVRLGAQVVACLVMILGGGIVLTDLGNLGIGGGLLVLGSLSVPFTIFASIGVINAMNMCDGLDGLSGSLALVSLLGFGVANTLWGDAGNQHVIVIFAACVSSFLMFNLRTLWRSKACVFLGDAGSMLLGVTLCWLAISLSQGEERAIFPAAALWFLMLPIYDTLSMMVRRLAKKRSPFHADREHLHHIFLLAGFSVGETVTLMSGTAVAGVVIGLASVYFKVPDLYVAALFFVGACFHYWGVHRAWRVMVFLRRSICRRSEAERRAVKDRRKFADPAYSGPERRSGVDRRQMARRRAGERSDQIL